MSELPQAVQATDHAPFDLATLSGDQRRHIAFTNRVLEASSDCIKVLDLEGRLVLMNLGGQRVMEIDDFSLVAGQDWLDFWAGEGAGLAGRAIAEARAGRPARFEGYALTFKGNLRWWEVALSPILGEDGAVEQILSISRDVSERKASEEHLRLLLREMQHRVKNTLAMTQAVAAQTLRHAVDLPSAREALDGRLAALGQAHDLLVREDWRVARLQEVARTALGPYDDGDKICLSGPEVEVSASGALAIAMALNELATNATKYGALSNDAGRVTLSWTISDATLEVTWREVGGPPVSEPTDRGFGTLLIERSLARQFRGEALISFPPQGVVCEIRVLLSELQARA